MGRSRSHKRKNNNHRRSINKTELEQFNERTNNLLILKHQIEIANKIINRLPLACKNAGFINAPDALINFGKGFSRLTEGLLDNVNDRLLTIDMLVN